MSERREEQEIVEKAEVERQELWTFSSSMV